jgi:signal transduction histidine kinase
LSLEKIQQTISNTRKLLGIVGLVALGFGCLVSIHFAGRVTRPVASLVKDVEAISKGDYKQEVNNIGIHGEIGEIDLTAALEQIAADSGIDEELHKPLVWR